MSISPSEKIKVSIEGNIATSDGGAIYHANDGSTFDNSYLKRSALFDNKTIYLGCKNFKYFNFLKN